MVKYKMKYYGSAQGRISGRTYRFDKGQIIETKSGEFDDSTAEEVKDIVKEVKEHREVQGQKVETSVKKRKRSR
jgi:hypothetical protein